MSEIKLMYLVAERNTLPHSETYNLVNLVFDGQ